ncbi:hypothetical protein [Clostridium massiliamazoniense]|uniref:hypothetical protein n=1 Tax=Clostridium massiliamazoniense TaxID=1347366 RepID=UPI0006D7EE48|nr:hypothetical protein [Clostridium massiliamazoniense]
MQKITLARKIYKEIVDLDVKENVFVEFIKREVLIEDIYYIAPTDEMNIEYIDVDEKWWNVRMELIISSLKQCFDRFIVRDDYVRYILLDVAHLFLVQWISRNQYAEDDKMFMVTYNRLQEQRANLKEWY